MRYSTSDLSRKSGDIIASALRSPVIITQRGKPRLIIISIEEFNKLRGKKPSTTEDPALSHPELLPYSGNPASR